MSQMMKALVKREAARGIWMEEVPVPEIGPNDVLVKLEKTAICGTDLHIYKWDEWSQRVIKPGLVIGHEFVGRIVDIGAGVRASQIVPAAVRSSIARIVPSLIGTSGTTVISSGVIAIPSVTAAGQLTNPSVCGAEAVKSSVSWSPATVATRSIG